MAKGKNSFEKFEKPQQPTPNGGQSPSVFPDDGVPTEIVGQPSSGTTATVESPTQEESRKDEGGLPQRTAVVTTDSPMVAYTKGIPMKALNAREGTNPLLVEVYHFIRSLQAGGMIASWSPMIIDNVDRMLKKLKAEIEGEPATK